MTAKFSSVLTIISGLTVSTFVGAQPAAPAAPAAQPKTAAAPVAQPAPAARAAGAPVAQPAAAPQRPGALVTQPNTAAPRAAVAPIAQPNAAAPAPQPNVAGAAAQTTGAQLDPMTATVTTREAPKGRNPVMEAFAPQQNGLTARMVAKRAVASSHTIEAKNAELRAAAAKVDSAMYQFLPRVALKASYSRLSRVKVSLGGDGNSLGAITKGPFTTGGPNGTLGQYFDHDNNPATPEIWAEVRGDKMNFPVIVDNYSLSATLSVPLSDYVLRMSDSIQGTKKNQQASELNIKAERTKVEGDARVAFYNWARAIGQVAITENSIERVRARLKDVEASFTVGMVTKTDLLRLQSQVATTEAGLEAARAFRSLASQQLAVIMNDAESANYALGEDVMTRPSPRPIEPLEQLVAEAQRQRYELQALDRSAESLRYAESVVRKGQLPRIDGFGDYTYANPNQRYFFTKAWKGTWAVGAQLTWTVNDVLTSGASANEMSAQRDSVLANRRALADGIRLEVTSAYTDTQRVAAELDAAQRAMDASQAAYDTATQLFKVGKATTTELIDAEGELVASQLRLINAQIDTRVAQTKLTRALGRDLQKLEY